MVVFFSFYVSMWMDGWQKCCNWQPDMFPLWLVAPPSPSQLCSRWFSSCILLSICAGLHLFSDGLFIQAPPFAVAQAAGAPTFFFLTRIANTAALSITGIYIKSEINFTLFSLSNYVNSCCEKQSCAHEF